MIFSEQAEDQVRQRNDRAKDGDGREEQHIKGGKQHGEPVALLRFFLRLLAADPRLRVCFDTNHLLRETHGNFVKAVGEKIVTTHVSDYDFIDEKHWLPGEGKVDWPTLTQLLKNAGYGGVWLYEVGFKAPRSRPRSRDLTCEDFVRNAREIFGGFPITAVE